MSPEELIASIEARSEQRFTADIRSRLVECLKWQLEEQRQRILGLVGRSHLDSMAKGEVSRLVREV